MTTTETIPPANGWLGRRAFLCQGGLLLAGSTVARPERLLAAAAQSQPAPLLRAGLITDLHYADKPSTPQRFYRDSLRKLDEALGQFQREQAQALFVLGDSIDSADTLEAELGYLHVVAGKILGAPGRKSFVLGNHCVSALTKAEFLEAVKQPQSYCSFDLNGWHFVILDGCFRKDGTPYGRKNFEWTDASVPPAELDWLQEDLRRTERKAIVLVHQRLDTPPPYGVGNAEDVRRALEASGKVALVLQGHFHPGDYRHVGGIHYATLSALVEGAAPDHNAYAVLEILPGDILRIRGFRKQRSFEWP